MGSIKRRVGWGWRGRRKMSQVPGLAVCVCFARLPQGRKRKKSRGGEGKGGRKKQSGLTRVLSSRRRFFLCKLFLPQPQVPPGERKKRRRRRTSVCELFFFTLLPLAHRNEVVGCCTYVRCSSPPRLNFIRYRHRHLGKTDYLLIAFIFYQLVTKGCLLSGVFFSRRCETPQTSVLFLSLVPSKMRDAQAGRKMRNFSVPSSLFLHSSSAFPPRLCLFASEKSVKLRNPAIALLFLFHLSSTASSSSLY